MRRAIARKRDGGELAPGDWEAIVAAFLDGHVDDAQLAALLMACVLRGLSERESFALTAAFVASGERLEAPDARTVDKHSSGGVGDTASLIVVPLVAACGIPVAKLSGRALGHTGGTLDKLEAIDGVRTALAPDEFFACVRSAGCAIAAQSERLVPADKRIYALRDRTATVPSPGLIAASIVSKKIAGGAPAIVYDVKAGSGAFMPDVAEARDLAQLLVVLGSAFGRRSRALVSDMNEPLGPAIGTGLEAIEARDFLSGTRRDPRLGALCAALAVAMLEVAGFSGDARASLQAALVSGRAYATFEAMLAAQGAKPGALERLAPHASRTPVTAARPGFVTAVDPVALGELARDLVARDGSRAGIVVAARTGDRLAAGALLATVYGAPEFAAAVRAAFSLGEHAPPARPLVYCEIGEGCETGAGAAADGAESASGDARSTLEIK
jgi:pyrimidine-nucleoside phosphorylase